MPGVHHPARSRIEKLYEPHPDDGAAEYVADGIDAVEYYHNGAVGTAICHREAHAVREKRRLAGVHFIVHALATERESARCAHDDAHIGNAEAVEKGFRERVYVAF